MSKMEYVTNEYSLSSLSGSADFTVESFKIEFCSPKNVLLPVNFTEDSNRKKL